MENGTSEEQDRGSYIRWQEIALEQLGYVINLFFTLTGAVLAFAVKFMMNSEVHLPTYAHCMFHISLLALGVSIASSLAANTARAMDFRYSRRAAYARWKGKPDHDTFRDRAENCGKWTWWLFYFQTATLSLGALLLCFSIWLGYSHQI